MLTRYRAFTPLTGWMILGFVAIPHFVWSSADGHSRCLHFLDVMNSAAVDIRLQGFAWRYVFRSVGDSQIPGSHRNSVFNFLRNSPHCFPQCLHNCTGAIVPKISEGSSFSTSSPTLIFYLKKSYIHPGGYKWYPTLGFHLHL